MRIGILCHASLGGSARVATRLAEELARRGHRVGLFTRTVPYGEWGCADGVTLHVTDPGGELDHHPAYLHTDWPAEEIQEFSSQILDAIAAEELDILHFHYAVPFAFVAARVRHDLGDAAPALVGTLHGTDVYTHGRRPETKRRLKRALRELDALTTVSHAHARLSKEVLDLPVEPAVIPNFVDLPRFRPERHVSSNPVLSLSKEPVLSLTSASLRAEPQAEGSVEPSKEPVLSLSKEPEAHPRPVIVHISNFRPIKDLAGVVRIFLGIRKQMKAELWLVGDGQVMDEAQALLQASPFENDVRYWGMQRDVASILPQADLLLSASLYESFCLVALEALACGVPVLATDVGGLPEVVRHGETGYLYPVGDYATAVSHAVNLLSDQRRHRTMCEMAVLSARRFDQQRIVSTYEDLYRRLLCQPRPEQPR
jgi:glycosyltransferase involved in cell wall biosynthesis